MSPITVAAIQLAESGSSELHESSEVGVAPDSNPAVARVS